MPNRTNGCFLPDIEWERLWYIFFIPNTVTQKSIGWEKFKLQGVQWCKERLVLQLDANNMLPL